MYDLKDRGSRARLARESDGTDQIKGNLHGVQYYFKDRESRAPTLHGVYYPKDRGTRAHVYLATGVYYPKDRDTRAHACLDNDSRTWFTNPSINAGE